MSGTLKSAAVCADGTDLGQYLLDRGVLSAAELLRARGERIGGTQGLLDTLLHIFPDRATQLYNHTAQWRGIPHISDRQLQTDMAFTDPADLRRYLRFRVLPLSNDRSGLKLAIADPDLNTEDLRATLGLGSDTKISLVLANERAILKGLEGAARSVFGPLASTRSPAFYSFRKSKSEGRRWTICLVALTLAVFGCGLVWPRESLTFLSLWGCLMLFCTTSLKLAILAQLPKAPPTGVPQNSAPAPRPTMSILVPLFREPEVATLLQKRLTRLRYPAGMLEILLLLEEEDTQTKEALAGTVLPANVRILTVPDGQPRTKPRAMNYALDFCKGDIIGIYDAEDAPHPDQLLRVAEAFADAPDDLACVQGVLDYYNPRQGWLARCFTIEYASWFRVILPGMRRLGFAIPLGGTTLFCRRDALLEVGGWDAHNVTEDADLGIRLARFGYRSELLPSTTLEEANCRLLPWIRQRSRWLKGYMVTYLVHMRRPLRLFKDLGAWQFFGLQLHFVTTLSQVLLVPLLWSFWAILIGLPHPLAEVVPQGTLVSLGTGFLIAELVVLATAAVAVSGPAHRHLLPWVLSLHLYFPLAAFAAYKALYELIFRPVYWDKTQHGLSIRAAPEANRSQTPVAHRVKLQPRGEGL